LLLLLRSAQQATITTVISSFKHKGLQQFYATGSTAGIRSEHQKRLRLQLTALDTSHTLDDMNIPGFRPHPLKGNRKGYWAIAVSGNWRLVFRFANGNVYDLNYEDYH
jgi:toxin HigB-1